VKDTENHTDTGSTILLKESFILIHQKMADERPEILEGYLGPQEGFAEMGLSTKSHRDFEIETNDNKLEIRMTSKIPLKLATQLLNCRTNDDQAEYVFIHTKDGDLIFEIQFPEKGYYKFQLFALLIDEDGNDVPNVFNYLIHCKRAMEPVFVVPLSYVQWRNGCYLNEPKYLNKDMKLTKVKWSVIVPNAHAVAVVADGKWYHFEKKGGEVFETVMDLDHLRAKDDAKLTLNANYVRDETKYCTLLQYRL